MKIGKIYRYSYGTLGISVMYKSVAEASIGPFVSSIKVIKFHFCYFSMYRLTRLNLIYIQENMKIGKMDR